MGEWNRKDWRNEHEIEMLRLVSLGKNWSEIAREPIFVYGSFDNTFIKKQFETCQRMKFRALYNYFLNSYARHISDKTLQIILRVADLNEYL